MLQTRNHPQLLSVTETANQLNVHRSTIYRLFAAGELPSVHIGRRRLVAKNALAVYIAQLT